MRDQDKILNSVENEFAYVGLREDGILHFCYKNDIELNKEAIDIILDMIIKFAYPNKYPLIVEVGDYVNFVDEGRKYMAEVDHLIPSTKTVLFLHTMGYKLVAKHFIKNNKPRKDYKILNDFDKAIAWLLED